MTSRATASTYGGRYWEIKPGDSLRRKIDEGISGAKYFLVLLTRNSLKSEWVQTELDAGMVRRIEGSCRLIPVVLDLRDVTLRGVRWVKLDDYGAGIRELVNVCHELETKPPLGPPPARAETRPVIGLNLSVTAQKLAMLLAEQSETGDTLDPLLPATKALEDLQLTEPEAALAADELDELGWVKLHLHVGMGKVGFGRISPTPLLFFNMDPHVKGWNPEADARNLAAFLVNHGDDLVALSEADKELQWGPRRINPGAHFLVLHELAIGHRRQAGVQPYAFYYLQVTPKTKRFVSG